MKMGDFAKAVKLTQELVKKLMADYKISITNVVQHNKWTGKNCPENIRKTPNGWKNFIDGIDEPEWKKILRTKLDRPDDWIHWIESQSNHPLAK